MSGILHPLIASVPQGIKHMGSVTDSHDFGNQWNAANRLDVLSVASLRDLVVISFTFDSSPDSTWDFEDMGFTTLLDTTGTESPGHFTGYRFIDGTESNPYISGLAANSWAELSVVASVFRRASAFEDSDANYQFSTSLPNPPLVVASGKLWITSVNFEDNSSALRPSGYTLSGSSTAASTTTAIAYKIEDLSFDNPSSWVMSDTASANTTTIAFS